MIGPSRSEVMRSFHGRTQPPTMESSPSRLGVVGNSSSNSSSQHDDLHDRKCWLSLAFCTWPQSNSSSHGDSFKKLAQEGRFAQIIAKLKSSDDGLKQWLNAPSDVNGESPLHVLLQFQPPLDAVVALVQAMQDMNPHGIPEATSDGQGRTPLHVACAFGCSVAVVARLLNGAAAQFLVPAAVQDAAFMIPLHWACHALGASEIALSKRHVDNMIQVIAFLVEVFPAGLVCQNAAGYTPRQLLHSLTLPKASREALQTAIDRSTMDIRSSNNTTSDNDSLFSLAKPSWMPNEIYVDDEELEVSLLGTRGATKRRGGGRSPGARRTTTCFDTAKHIHETYKDSSSSKVLHGANDVHCGLLPVDDFTNVKDVVDTSKRGVSVDMFTSATLLEINFDECLADESMDDNTWHSFDSGLGAFNVPKAPTSRASRSKPIDVDLFVPEWLALNVTKDTQNTDRSVSTTQASSSSNDNVAAEVVEKVNQNTTKLDLLWI